eukprot:2480608-Pyramimonas_sp.AAC.1
MLITLGNAPVRLRARGGGGRAESAWELAMSTTAKLALSLWMARTVALDWPGSAPLRLTSSNCPATPTISNDPSSHLSWMSFAPTCGQNG